MRLASRLVDERPPPLVHGPLGRLGELNAALGFPLSAAQVARCEVLRARLPSSLPIAWMLGVEFIGDAVTRWLPVCVDVVLSHDGVLDHCTAHGATFVFFGLGAQAGAVLAGQELTERLELAGDGLPHPPAMKLALTGSRLRADSDAPVEGDGVKTLRSLLRRTPPGACLLARSLALGVADLVEVSPVHDDVRLAGRKPLPVRPTTSVGLEPLLRLLDTRVEGLERGLVSPLLIAGPPRSGRTHLAKELHRRVEAAGCFVGRSTGLSGTGAPYSAVVEVLCHLAQVPFEERFAALGPALEALKVTPARRQAALLLAGLAPSPTALTPALASATVRMVVEDVARERRRVLVFDGLDHADEESLETFRELCRSPRPRELIIGVTSTETASTIPAEQVFAVPKLTLAQVESLVVSCLGVAPRELRDALYERSGGYPGLVVELLLLTASRGVLRPREESLTLEGVVPQVSPIDLPLARLASEGTRVHRLLEAYAALGAARDESVLSRLVPELTSTRPRAWSARLLVEHGARPQVLAGVDEAMREFDGSMAQAARTAQALLAAGDLTLAGRARIASVWEQANNPQRAGQTWREVAEAALECRDLASFAAAHEGMARALEFHPEKAGARILPVRLSSWAQAACARLALRDVDGAQAALDEGLRVQPDGVPPSAELALAAVRVRRAQRRLEEAQAHLEELMLASRTSPLRAAALAEQGELREEAQDLTGALDAWHQALGASPAFLPLAGAYGEVEFRARIEARIGALFIAQGQHGRARTWLVSAMDRFQTAGALTHAARVMANLGRLMAQASAWSDAAPWFELAASTAEAGGDFLFHTRQLISLAKVLARLGDARARELARRAADLSVELGWPDGAAAVQQLL